MGDLKSEDKVEVTLLKLKASWKKQKKKGSKHALFLAVIYAFRSKLRKTSYFYLGQYLTALSVNILVTMLNLSSPFLIKHIIEYLQSEPGAHSTGDGLLYVGLLICT
jgi:hypothetical protein